MLDDAHDACEVFKALLSDANVIIFQRIALRVRPTNALIMAMHKEWRSDGSVLRITPRLMYIDVCFTGGFVDALRTQLLRHDDAASSQTRDEVQLAMAFQRVPCDLVFGRFTRAYTRLTTPHAALLLFVERKYAEYVFRQNNVLPRVLRTGDIAAMEEHDWCSQPQSPTVHWRTVSDAMFPCLSQTGSMYLVCAAGPAGARNAVYMALREEMLLAEASQRFRVLDYFPPIDCKLDVPRLRDAFQKYYEQARLVFDVSNTFDDFLRTNAGRFLRPLACSHYRWSYQHNTCRELTIVLLNAYKCVDFNAMLPAYVVLWIFDWLDEEFVWRSSETQRIELIIAVRRSMENVRMKRKRTL